MHGNWLFLVDTNNAGKVKKFIISYNLFGCFTTKINFLTENDKIHFLPKKEVEEIHFITCFDKNLFIIKMSNPNY